MNQPPAPPAGAPPALAPRIRLYDWPVSPFCHKVRAVLEHKGLPYERLPALSNRGLIRRRGGVGKVPALELDAEFLVDSTDIVHELERRFPDCPVLPPSASARALCHVLEDWADESLYFLGLYHHWHEPAGVAAARRYFHRSWAGVLLFPPLRWRIERQLAGQGVGRKAPAQVRADLERNLDAVEALLEPGPFLLGDGPWLCDHALLAQLVYLQRAAALGGLYAERPAIRAFLERMRALRGA